MQSVYGVQFQRAKLWQILSIFSNFSQQSITSMLAKSTEYRNSEIPMTKLMVFNTALLKNNYKLSKQKQE